MAGRIDSTEDQKKFMEMLMLIVARVFNLKVKEIRSPSRKRNLALARFSWAWNAFRFLEGHVSLETMGDFLSGRDHSTIIHARERYKYFRKKTRHPNHDQLRTIERKSLELYEYFFLNEESIQEYEDNIVLEPPEEPDEHVEEIKPSRPLITIDDVLKKTYSFESTSEFAYLFKQIIKTRRYTLPWRECRAEVEDFFRDHKEDSLTICGEELTEQVSSLMKELNMRKSQLEVQEMLLEYEQRQRQRQRQR